MALLRLEISMSLDGFVAGPNAGLDHPLGHDGERLHEWIFGLASWRASHGEEGGEAGPDDDVVQRSLATQGAVIMGRKMFSGGEGPWEDDPNADAWWGDDPPFKVPVFVLTHHARAPETKRAMTFTFVTDGIESALDQARAAAGDRDVLLAGGADVARQYLAAGLLDEMEIHIAPVLLGDGLRLFDGSGVMPLECTSVSGSPAVAHLSYARRAMA
jgi:dihydrofolate reductase